MLKNCLRPVSAPLIGYHGTKKLEQTFFSIVTHFVIRYHISLVNVQTSYCNNNLLILDVKQLNKIIALYYFHTLKALWDVQGKIKIYYRMSRLKKQLSRKRSIIHLLIVTSLDITIKLNLFYTPFKIYCCQTQHQGNSFVLE